MQYKSNWGIYYGEVLIARMPPVDTKIATDHRKEIVRRANAYDSLTAENTKLKADRDALIEALKANHAHHLEYGADYDYEGSELHRQNCAAIEQAEAEDA